MNALIRYSIVLMIMNKEGEIVSAAWNGAWNIMIAFKNKTQQKPQKRSSGITYFLWVLLLSWAALDSGYSNLVSLHVIYWSFQNVTEKQKSLS